MARLYENHNKDLKVINIKCTQKKLIRPHYIVMMIRDYKHLIGLQHIHTKQQMK